MLAAPGLFGRNSSLSVLIFLHLSLFSKPSYQPFQGQQCWGKWPRVKELLDSDPTFAATQECWKHFVFPPRQPKGSTTRKSGSPGEPKLSVPTPRGSNVQGGLSLAAGLAETRKR